MSQTNFLEITSVQNQTIKDILKLHLPKYRKTSGLVFLEGEKSVLGALDEGIRLDKILCTDSKIALEFSKKTDAQIILTNQKVMDKISTVKSSSPLCAVAYEPKYTLDEIIKSKKILLLDSIKDAGNFGTIIRSACAFGIGEILLFGSCTDGYSSKVVRSSAGNIFKVKIHHLGEDISLMQKIKKTHKIISTVAPYGQYKDHAVDCSTINYAEPFVIMLGSEASGLCKELLSISDIYATLKTENSVESLNLAVFGSILMYIINSKKY